jgi:hypothetical protein
VRMVPSSPAAVAVTAGAAPVAAGGGEADAVGEAVAVGVGGVDGGLIELFALQAEANAPRVNTAVVSRIRFIL